MLTTESYVVGLLAYGGAAVIAISIAYFTLLRGFSPLWRGAVAGFCAGVLLAPAYPPPEATTLAPALVVVVFNTLFGDGWSAAVPAFALLLSASAAGVLLGLGLGLISRSRAGRPAHNSTTDS